MILPVVIETLPLLLLALLFPVLAVDVAVLVTVAVWVMVMEVVLVLERLTELSEFDPLLLIVTFVSPEGQQPTSTFD